MRTRTDVLVIGAGPIGLEVAYELSRAGVEYLQVDKGQIGSTIAWFPEQMSFFSSNDRIGIAGIPLQTPGQRKCTKEEYLAYLRTVASARNLAVRTYVEVIDLRRQAEGGFVARTNVPSLARSFVSRKRRACAARESEIEARNVVLAIGDMDRPRRLGIPGEELPHVSHYFTEPHRYYRSRLLVVGGKNSAIEAALRCWHAGAHVTLSYRRAAIDERAVKYWLLPEFIGRVRRGEIDCHYGTVPKQIRPGSVLLGPDGREVAADFVLLLVGYVADQRLLEMAGVRLDGPEHRPILDERTMQTEIEGLFVAGTATAGTQQSYSVFIENCHIHAARIAAALTGAPPPADPRPITRPES